MDTVNVHQQNSKNCSLISGSIVKDNSDNICDNSNYNRKSCVNKVLNLLSLNCCGLKSKLNYPEFHEFVNTFDILCFVESKTDDLDEIVLPGFLIKMKNRKSFSKRIVFNNTTTNK
jgi:hypothetical protein